MDDTYSLPIPEVVPDGDNGAIVRFAEMAQLCQLRPDRRGSACGACCRTMTG